jgi:outer membrane protein assembly complex protein YaeT
LRFQAVVLLVAVAAAASPPLAAQQEQQRVVRSLDFEGNHAIDDYTLSSAIATSNSSAFASLWLLRWTQLGEKRYLNELEFRRDVLRLRLLYSRSGYVNAVVDTIVRRTSRDAFITFRITEGEPVRVTHLELIGADSLFDVTRLKHDLPFQVGAPFNRFLLQASVDTLVTLLRNRGYPYAQVLREFDEDDAALTATASLEIVPGPHMAVGVIDILGLERVDTSTVRDMLSLKPGEPFRQDKLYQSQRDLYDLGVFRSVNIFLADSTGPATPGDTTVRIVVRVAEGAGHRVLTGVGYGTVDCFRAQAAWTSYRFFGGMRSLDVTASASKIGVGEPLDLGFGSNVCRSLANDPMSDTLNYNVGLSLRQPTFFSPRHTARLGVYAQRRSDVSAYTRKEVGVNAAVTINARRNIPVIFGYTFTVGQTTAEPAVFCDVFVVCDAADQAALSSKRPFGAFTITGARILVNSLLDPTAGGTLTVGLMYASHFLGSDTLYEFTRGEAQVARYYQLGRRGVFAWRVRAGMIFPKRHIELENQSVEFVPPDQRFYGGGPNSVRGYHTNEMGPRVYVTGDTTNFVANGADTTYLDLRTSPTGGTAVFTINLEARFATPLFPSRMRFAVFTDVGQVWQRGSQLIDVSGVRVTPGVGLRFATFLGPVRVDAAYNGYAAEAGPIYYDNGHSLILYRDSYQPTRPDTFWKRVIVQFSVGQAF